MTHPGIPYEEMDYADLVWLARTGVERMELLAAIIAAQDQVIFAFTEAAASMVPGTPPQVRH